LIRLEGVERVYRGPRGEPVHALRALDLAVERGETLCLLGPSGCGKTTTLRLVNRLEHPTAGRVLVDGEDVARADPIRLRRGMGYVIQSGGLFPHLTVRDNVALLPRLEGHDPREADARADALLETVHLDPSTLGERYPSELSGGQRQRVGVARALALDPPILLMDEPFGALDPITRRGLQDELLELLAGADKTVVLVTHDLAEAFRLGDRVALLDAGRLVQVGTLDEIRRAPASPWVARFLEAEPDGR
jgi:osmoprotectant transport system ATP-binding protein